MSIYAPAWAVGVFVDNPTGDVSVRVRPGLGKIQVHVAVPSRVRRSDDVRYSNSSSGMAIECRPKDGARVDLELTVPETTSLEVKVATGTFALNGLVHSVWLETKGSDVRLSIPLDLMQFRVVTTSEAASMDLPRRADIRYAAGQRDGYWVLCDAPAKGQPEMRRSAKQEESSDPIERVLDSLPERGPLYGAVIVTGSSVGLFQVIDVAVPLDSRIKLPSYAEIAVGDLVGSEAPPDDKASNAPAAKETPAANTENGEALFVSDVRMVNLSFSVTDREGHALTGLKPEDFEVLEDGVPQTVRSAGSEEMPFRLVLLLDLSETTLVSRAAILEAARGFLSVARPQDRVAIYALAQTLFQVVSPLTSDRAALARAIDNLPPVIGQTPLYDAMVLSYAQESLALSSERSALVVLTDGMENNLQRNGRGSITTFKRLRQTVEQLPVMVYPILVRGDARFGPPDLPRQARHNMEEIAEASGGRTFPANSISDLAPVYRQVAEELRSVYTISYYPSNQSFDGNWRSVQVRVKRSGVTVRTRPGYFAR